MLCKLSIKQPMRRIPMHIAARPDSFLDNARPSLAIYISTCRIRCHICIGGKIRKQLPVKIEILKMLLCHISVGYRVKISWSYDCCWLTNMWTNKETIVTKYTARMVSSENVYVSYNFIYFYISIFLFIYCGKHYDDQFCIALQR